MRTIGYSLIEGVIASLIAVAVLEIYRVTRRHLTYRSIRRLLGGAKRIGVVSCSYPQTRSLVSVGLLTTDNAFALAEIIQACRKVGGEPILAPVTRIPDGFPDDMILLGGHIANDLTRRFLKEYCPGFGVCGLDEDSPEQAADSIWYDCARLKFIDDDQDAWAFIAKLSVDVTHSPRTVLMIWGRSSFGSTSAAHFFANRAGMLNAKRDQSVFYALRMSRQLHYQSLPMEIIDLTSEVFAIPSTPKDLTPQ